MCDIIGLWSVQQCQLLFEFYNQQGNTTLVFSDLIVIFKDSLQGNETEWEVVMKVKLKRVKENDKDVYRVQQVSNCVLPLGR
jgi:hypothetical protein